MKHRNRTLYHLLLTVIILDVLVLYVLVAYLASYCWEMFHLPIVESAVLFLLFCSLVWQTRFDVALERSIG